MSLSSEVYWLVLTCLMTGLLWVPYIINRIIEQSPLPAIWNPYPDGGAKRAWAQRMMRAHENAVENLVIFAPLVILIELLNLNSETSAWAVLIYFYARLGHFIVMSFAIPVLRVVFFMTGFAAQLTLVLQLLGYF